MGCDIHPVVQYREREHWISLVDDMYLSRDYVMFGCLVDGHGRAYNGEKGVVPERGLPPGTEKWPEWRDKGCGEDVGEHTFSWLDAAEFREALKRATDYRLLQFGSSNVGHDYLAVAAMLDSLTESYGAENVRIVFGFDN